MTSSLSSGLDWIGLASSFLLVLGLLALLLFALKRMQGMSLGPGGQRQIQMLETLSAGTRQKIVLLRVKDRDILIGVSATQITALADWANHPEATPTATPPVAGPRTGLTPSDPTAPTAPTTPRFAADPRTGKAPTGGLSFSAVMEHARMPRPMVQFFKRRGA